MLLEKLHGLEQPEGYDEPELLSFVCEWLDPWQGNETRMISGIGKTILVSTTSKYYADDQELESEN